MILSEFLKVDPTTDTYLADGEVPELGTYHVRLYLTSTVGVSARFGGPVAIAASALHVNCPAGETVSVDLGQFTLQATDNLVLIVNAGVTGSVFGAIFLERL